MSRKLTLIAFFCLIAIFGFVKTAHAQCPSLKDEPLTTDKIASSLQTEGCDLQKFLDSLDPQIKSSATGDASQTPRVILALPKLTAVLSRLDQYSPSYLHILEWKNRDEALYFELTLSGQTVKQEDPKNWITKRRPEWKNYQTWPGAHGHEQGQKDLQYEKNLDITQTFLDRATAYKPTQNRGAVDSGDGRRSRP